MEIEGFGYVPKRRRPRAVVPHWSKKAVFAFAFTLGMLAGTAITSMVSTYYVGLAIEKAAQSYAANNPINELTGE